MDAGPRALHQRSVRLAAEESRDIELIVLGRFMHRCGAAMRVKTLWTRSPRVLRHGLCRPTFRLTRGRALLWAFELRRGPCRGTRHGGRCRRFPLRSPAKAN